MRTQVEIVGGGPAGLLLARLLGLAGIETSSSSGARGSTCSPASAPACSSRARSTCSSEAGVGARLHAEGLVHDGVELAFAGARHRIDLKASPAASVVTVYGQTEITKDLMDARAPPAPTIVYEAEDVSLHDFDSDSPERALSQGRREHEIDCDFIAGCDGFHGVSRAGDPDGGDPHLRARLSVRLARRAVGHAAGRRTSSSTPTTSAASPCAPCARRTRSRYYVQCPLDEHVDEWPDDALLGRTQPAPRRRWRRSAA